MHTSDDARGDHPQLHRMIEDLRALLTAEQLRLRPKARVAYELLCDLGEQVQRHLADAPPGPAPRSLVQDKPQDSRNARGFISAETLMRQTFEDYHGRWLENCDFNFNDAFFAETHAVFEMVVQRIEHAPRAQVPTLADCGRSDRARV